MSPALQRRRAVLLDRHPIWLEAVEQVLGRAGIQTVGKATAVEPALALLVKHRPEIFVIEIETPTGDGQGLTCLREARKRAPNVRAIVLSSHEDTNSIEQALAAGAVAYVVKTAHPDDFASAVRQAFSHSIYFAGAPERTAPPSLVAGTEAVDLTRREHEILLLVAEGLSNAELARRLWVTEQTVKFHLSNVYRKLDVSNRTEASRWAHVNGLLPPARSLQTTAA
jgi:DNA-binding NarL/FixJ family response regulator